MAAKAIPIVRKGNNGAWIDITEKGKYGFGFQNAIELARILDYAINKSIMDPDKIVQRAYEFKEEVFEQKIAKIIKEII